MSINNNNNKEKTVVSHRKNERTNFISSKKGEVNIIPLDTFNNIFLLNIFLIEE